MAIITRMTKELVLTALSRALTVLPPAPSARPGRQRQPGIGRKRTRWYVYKHEPKRKWL